MKLITLISTIAFVFIVSFSNAQADKTKTLKIGDAIPDIELMTMDNAPTLLSTSNVGQRLVIIYYRANWCPFCNAHLADLQPYFRQLTKLGYKLIAISTESTTNLKRTKDNGYLTYTLLSDAKMTGITKFGIANGNVAVPSVFITDPNHKINYIYTNTDYKVRLSGEAVYKKALELKR